MTLPIFAIVEGHGERHAVPVLIRRLAHECFGRFDVEVLPPVRRSRGKILQPNVLGKDIELGRRRIKEYSEDGGIIILFDADDECPKTTAAGILTGVRAKTLDIGIDVVMPKREYEAWFLAAASSLRGHRSVSPLAEPPPNPEEVRGAKEYFAEHLLVQGAVYSETADQASYTAKMDLEEASRCRSFRKLQTVCELLFRNRPGMETG